MPEPFVAPSLTDDPKSCWHPSGHAWSIARDDGRQECLWCYTHRWLPVIEVPVCDGKKVEGA